jgi:hypothetical protein
MTIYTPDIYAFPTNEKARASLNSFISRANELFEGADLCNILGLNSEIFSHLSEFDLEKIFVSITTSDSLFYRFKIKGNPYEFKLELSFEQSNEPNIESILHIYKNGIKDKSTFGSLYYTLDVIYSLISPEDSTFYIASEDPIEVFETSQIVFEEYYDISATITT